MTTNKKVEGTSEVEATPGAGKNKTPPPKPGTTPGTSEVEAKPEAAVRADPRKS